MYQVEAKKAVVRRYFDERWNTRNYSSVDETRELIDMSAEENKAVFLRYFEEAWAQRSEDDHRAGDDQEMDEFHAAFGDLKATPDLVLAAEDDHVLIRFTVTAVHRKDYRGIPATGKPISWWGTTVARMENGKIVDEFAVAEKMGAVMFGVTSWLDEVGWSPQN